MASGTIKAVPTDDEVIHSNTSQDTFESVVGAKWFQTRYFAFGCGAVSRYHALYAKFNSDASNYIGTLYFDSGSTSGKQTSNRFSIASYSPNSTPDASNTGYYEVYRFPTPEAGLTSNQTYQVLTTKDCVKNGIEEVSTGLTGITAYKSGHNLILRGADLSVTVNAGSYTKICDIPTALRPVGLTTPVGICYVAAARTVGYCFVSNNKLYASCEKAATFTAFQIQYFI